MRFDKGDKAIITLRGQSRKHERQINAFLNDAVVLDIDTVMITSIRKIGVPNSRKGIKLKSAGSKIAFAGLALFAGDLITVTLVQNQEYTVNPAVTIVSGVLIGAGWTMTKIKPTVRINRRHRLLIIRSENNDMMK